MDCNIIMAVVLDHRTDTAPEVQEIFTEYGCLIRSRIGLHQTGDCSEDGLILLQLCADTEEVQNLTEDLEGVEGVRVKTMNIDFYH